MQLNESELECTSIPRFGNLCPSPPPNPYASSYEYIKNIVYIKIIISVTITHEKKLFWSFYFSNFLYIIFTIFNNFYANLWKFVTNLIGLLNIKLLSSKKRKLWVDQVKRNFLINCSQGLQSMLSLSNPKKLSWNFARLIE